MGDISREEDSDLLERIVQGDTAAFDIFYEQHWAWVFNAAYKRLENVEISKDIAQEVFSQLWVQLQSDNAPVIENIRAYLYVIVRNHVFKWMEKEKRFVSISDVLDRLERKCESADAAILYEELLASYREVVEKMSPQQRLVFQMRYDEGLASQEIAGLLQVSEKTVRNQLGRAIGKVKSRIIASVIFLLSTVFC